MPSLGSRAGRQVVSSWGHRVHLPSPWSAPHHGHGRWEASSLRASFVLLFSPPRPEKRGTREKGVGVTWPHWSPDISGHTRAPSPPPSAKILLRKGRREQAGTLGKGRNWTQVGSFPTSLQCCVTMTIFHKWSQALCLGEASGLPGGVGSVLEKYSPRRTPETGWGRGHSGKRRRECGEQSRC